MFQSAMQIDADDSFLGTSIQFSEQEILRLEREHAAKVEQTVDELLQSGFMDTDYEDSDTDSVSESELCSEYKELEISDDVSSTSSFESVDESNRDLSISTALSSPCSECRDSLSSSESADTVLSSRSESVNSFPDSPAIDALDSGAVNDTERSAASREIHDVATNNNVEEEEEKMEDSDEPDDDDDNDGDHDISDRHYTNDELLTFMARRSLRNLMNVILSEFGLFALMLFLLATMPHIVHREEMDTNPFHGNSQRGFHCQTRIAHYWNAQSEQAQAVADSDDNDQDEDDQRDGDDQNNNNIERRSGSWNVDIRTTAYDYDTNTVYQCQHEIRIDDLFDIQYDRPAMAYRMEVPRMFVPFGAGIGGSAGFGPLAGSPSMMRIFKETVSVHGRQLVRGHGITALVMSIVGIAAFTAASGGLEELM